MQHRDEDQVILLVEDTEDDIELTLLALERSTIVPTVVVARDGVEALAYLFGPAAGGAPPGPLPKVVLLDLKLPRVSGLEVLQRIRAEARTRRLPVVILTSSDEEEDRLRGYDLGANSYIRKPVDFAQFTQAVQTMGVYWLVLNRAP
ncbi:MAG: response regulator [Chloroflexota bacterium]